MHITPQNSTPFEQKKPPFLPLNKNNENDGDGSIEDIVIIIIIICLEIEIVKLVVGGAKKTSFLSTTRTRT
jgi:hypothetical protein